MAGVATKTKDLLDKLGRRGPLGVDTGDLGFTGLPGAVYVPRGGSSPAPLIGFAHDWTKGPRHYADTFKYLASWGFVVVAPATSRGPLPNHQLFADQLSEAIENVLHARLGRGSVRADARRIGLAGHGMGAGVATLLASQRTDIDAVAAVFPKDTTPSAIERSVLCDCPSLILSASGGALAIDATELHRCWRGPVLHRRLDSAMETGFVERNPLLDGIGLADPDARTLRTVRPLLAGYLLATVAGDEHFAKLADPEEKVAKTTVLTEEMLDEEDDDSLAGAPPMLRLFKSVTGG